MLQPVLTRVRRESYDAIRALAAEREVAMADIVRQFIREGLAKIEAER